MKKLLFISNIAGKKGIDNFALANITAAKEQGLEFHTAINYSSVDPEVLNSDSEKYGVYLHHINFCRNPFSASNFHAFKELVNLIREENIDYIHCNTPVGGLLGRLAGKKCKVKKVIYQAHGFHFWKGAPLRNWIIYYPVERWLAHYTDALITINKEDYERAQRFKLKNNGKVYYVPGVGIDLSQFELPKNTRDIKRKELGLKETDVVLISAGELNANKNNKVIIEALGNLHNRNLHYYLCGVGPCEEELKELAESKGISEQVHFLGYRADIKELFRAADVFVMPSFREGLSRSIMEAMASGLPCIVSRIRGNVDLIEEGKGGFLCNPSCSEEFTTVLKQISGSDEERKKLGKYNLINVTEFDIERVEEDIEKIYRNLFNISVKNEDL